MEEDMNPQTQTQTVHNIYSPVGINISKKPITKLTTHQNPFQNELSKFVYYRTYSRWDDGKMRRETWDETVARAVVLLKKASKNKLKKSA